MADRIVNYQCICCGGKLRFDGGTGKLECDYCGSSFTTEEAEAMFKEKEERAAAAQKENENSSWDTNSLSDDWGSEAQGLRSYSCPSCGAELICDETTAATCCPYCGNQTVIPGQFSGALRPEFVIPFRKNKDEAVAALKEHYKGKTLLPKAFISDNHIDEIQGVYVPFWLYDCTARGRMSFHAEQSETKETANEKIVTTKHFTVVREGSLDFEKVPVDASKRMPDGHMDAIEPFDYADLKEFSTAYMPGFLADKYDEDSEVCGKRMEDRCKNALERSIRDTVTGYDRVNDTEKNIVVRKGSVHYAMLPVWLLSTNWNGQSFLFAMNGQSGKLVGDLPVDKGKYWGFFTGISAALVAAAMLVNFFVLSAPMAALPMVLFCILLPILIALGVVSGMKGKLRSVHTANAQKYAKGEISLTAKKDIFLRTTVSRTPKNTDGTNRNASR